MSATTLTRPACVRCDGCCQAMSAGYLCAGDVIEYDGRSLRVERMQQLSPWKFTVTFETGETVVYNGSHPVHFARR